MLFEFFESEDACKDFSNGKQQAVPEFIRRNQEAFNALDVDAVIYTATGCGAMLSEYPQFEQGGVRLRERL